MNSIMREVYDLFEMYQALRNQLMGILTDAELAFTPGGENPPLGELCREMGEVEYSYIQSFKTFTQDFEYHNETPGLAGSVDQLQAWFADLDTELRETLAALTEEDLVTKRVDRGPDFQVSPRWQLDIYKEALLIFYGKVSVYLKAMGKERPSQWQHWIA